MTKTPFRREDFPVLQEMIYCNHAGVAPIPKPTADAIRLYADQCSKAGAKSFSQWHPKINQTRADAATLLNSNVSEIAFVKSTTLGLNNVAWGLKWNPGDVIVVEENTFPANWYPWLGSRVFGTETWLWKQRGVGYDLGDLEKRLKKGGVRLVAATSASFSTGWRHDLMALGALCKQYGALLCVDTIQTAGVYPIDVKAMNIDFLSADSHKWMLGPEGAGIMYVAEEHLKLFRDDSIGWLGKSDFLNFQISDGPPDPTARRFEEGAPNNVGWLAMGESLKLLLEAGIDTISHQLNDHRQFLQDGLKDLGWKVINECASKHQSGICAMSHPSHCIDKVVDDLWNKRRVVATNRGGNLRLSPHAYQSREEMEIVLEAARSL